MTSLESNSSRVSTAKTRKPPAEAIAEAAMTQREIERELLRYAANIISTGNLQRSGIIMMLNAYCNDRYWANFRRYRTIAKVASIAMRRARALGRRACV